MAERVCATRAGALPPMPKSPAASGFIRASQRLYKAGAYHG